MRLAKNERGGSSNRINAFIVKVLASDIEMDGSSVEEGASCVTRVADTLLSSLVKVFCASPAIPTKVFPAISPPVCTGISLKDFRESIPELLSDFLGISPSILG